MCNHCAASDASPPGPPRALAQALRASRDGRRGGGGHLVVARVVCQVLGAALLPVDQRAAAPVAPQPLLLLLLEDLPVAHPVEVPRDLPLQPVGPVAVHLLRGHRARDVQVRVEVPQLHLRARLEAREAPQGVLGLAAIGAPRGVGGRLGHTGVPGLEPVERVLPQAGGPGLRPLGGQQGPSVALARDPSPVVPLAVGGVAARAEVVAGLHHAALVELRHALDVHRHLGHQRPRPVAVRGPGGPAGAGQGPRLHRRPPLRRLVRQRLLQDLVDLAQPRAAVLVLARGLQERAHGPRALDRPRHPHPLRVERLVAQRREVGVRRRGRLRAHEDRVPLDRRPELPPVLLLLLLRLLLDRLLLLHRHPEHARVREDVQGHLRGDDHGRGAVGDGVDGVVLHVDGLRLQGLRLVRGDYVLVVRDEGRAQHVAEAHVTHPWVSRLGQAIVYPDIEHAR
mmetsp:Transcript_127554/g.360944  ORF Transcript_127554/g.360944 Transcript_127554/m.360944 type:complete len:453 (+) Transcript_127554:230-1588(+)